MADDSEAQAILAQEEKIRQRVLRRQAEERQRKFEKQGKILPYVLIFNVLLIGGFFMFIIQSWGSISAFAAWLSQYTVIHIRL